MEQLLLQMFGSRHLISYSLVNDQRWPLVASLIASIHLTPDAHPFLGAMNCNELVPAATIWHDDK
jgi:hypothetical protein